MGKRWPTEEVPESGFFTYPDGPLTVKVKSQEDAETRNGKYVIKVESRVLEPKQFRNQPFNFNFVIGSDNDPEADNPETWTHPPSCYAASRYKSFLKACGVPNVGDTEEEAANTPDSIIVIDVGHHESDGKKYNDCNAFYSQQDAAGSTAQDATSKPAGRAALNGNGKPQGVSKTTARPMAKTTARPVRPAAAEPEPAGDDDWN